MPATGADHTEWLEQRTKLNIAYYRPGDSPKDDFERWLRKRGKTMYGASICELTAMYARTK